MTELWLLVLPMILWFPEQWLPFPAVIEELTKAFFVYRAIHWRQAMIWGLWFGIGEAMLFLVNANLLLSLQSFWWRLVLTVPMHGFSALGFYLFRKQKWLGIIVAVIIHAGFNLLVRR